MYLNHIKVEPYSRNEIVVFEVTKVISYKKKDLLAITLSSVGGESCSLVYGAGIFVVTEKVLLKVGVSCLRIVLLVGVGLVICHVVMVLDEKVEASFVEVKESVFEGKVGRRISKRLKVVISQKISKIKSPY